MWQLKDELYFQLQQKSEPFYFYLHLKEDLKYSEVLLLRKSYIIYCWINPQISLGNTKFKGK